MKEDKSKQDWLDDLRRRAEELLREKKGDITGVDALALVHELQVHKTELEMQNEELKRALRELEESRNKYLELYDFSPIGYFIVDKQGTILGVNLSGAKLLGIERVSLIKRRFQLFVSEDLWTGFNAFCNRVFGSDVKQTCELRLVRNDASQLYAHVEGMAMRDSEGNMKEWQIAVVDITERKQMEDESSKLREQLDHARRLESVGKLAGGIAHNFNNILMVVIGYASLLLDEMQEADPLRDYVQKIMKSSEMVASLTQGLLEFSRKQVANPKPVYLNKIVKDVEDLLGKVIRENIKLRTAFCDKDCVVMADVGQVQQVLMNLVSNGCDAMPNGGSLCITTDVAALESEFAKTHGCGEVGRYVLLSVSDTGVGMDKKVKERIFEPFFTTKEVGKGTGLGLAIVYGIVRQHNGYIDVKSEVGKGTTFRVYLPLATSEVSGTKVETEALPKGGTVTILIAEDEESVRNLMKIVLERNGYEVIEAVDGEDALDKFRKNKDKIQFLLLDVIMLGKSGKEVYEEIKKMKPDMKVLFMTGYSDDIVRKRDILNKGFDYILKPVSATELLERVRGVLDK
ncbi:MAG: response regulator [Planctomycetes bacterium]|nr:response regulator [Planctomycetota bacterium]